ncbi:MAG: 2Fe-2S ferredoxin [Alphaproteobacteria bacterium HGW-Alphaproteobacteria-12]|nr:MAG: 2Fe-2S ferredoxin [Alphaproteobacteria bacterium HGW-Alphaproteobacteria-12]
MTRAGMPAPGTPLCRLDEIGEPGAKGFVFGAGTARFEMFLVRNEGEVRAYVNECPHALTPLDIWPDTFLTQDKARIICATHAAQFTIADGLCTSGPCVGKSLEPMRIEVVDGMIRIAAN